MLKDIFDIKKFNIYSDDNNYYFFRALEELDLAKMEDGSILKSDGTLSKLITDREFYGETKYHENDEISLKEVFDHIKMHYDKHTNCISFTSNVNCALTYGRQTYDDKYVMVKVPKEKMGEYIYQAGLYMLEEIDKKINELVDSKDLEDYEVQKYFFDFINNAKSNDDLEKIKEMLPKEYVNDDSLYVGGINFNPTISLPYHSLNDEQNFIKNKIIMKLDILNKNLIPSVSNKFLIQTVGNAFSSLEIIHYKDVDGNNLTIIPKEMMDLLGIIQQLPQDIPYTEEVKKLVIEKTLNTKITGSFSDYDYSLVKENLSIENMYDITNGNVNYKVAKDLYEKAFYLAKARIRSKRSVVLLKNLLENNSKYTEIYNYLNTNSYGIEPELATRITGDFYNISESVSFNLNNQEKGLIEFINKLDYNQLNSIMTNPNEALKELITNFTTKEEQINISKEDWIANAIIDNFDWESLGVRENLSEFQRKDIVNKLKEHDFIKIYNHLKEKNVSSKQISNILFNLLVRNTYDENQPLTLEEIEWFIGYNQIKNTGLNLRYYQKSAVEKINKLFYDKQFAAAILPTGAGKSFVALAEIHERIINNPNEKILYLAPNVEILNQFKEIIRDVYNLEEHLGDNLDRIIKRNYPNLTLATYQDLKDLKTEDIKSKYADDYDLMIFDELHRTGAEKWQETVESLTNNQKKKIKILGLTATPRRDSDFKNMVDYWAYKYGYSENEIIKDKPMAVNMNLVEAIEDGIVLSPRVVLSMYSALKDGTMDEIEEYVNSIDDIEERNSKLNSLNEIKRNVENSNGIEKLIHENLANDGKYIVFLPVNKKENGEYEDEQGNIISKTTAEKIIKDYQSLMKQYIYGYDYLNNNSYVMEIYHKISNNKSLTDDEINYLNQEKENILLLTKIDIEGKSTALNTDTNLIADSIANYMNWEELSSSVKAKKLSLKTRDKVDTYSMLGSYSKKKNSDMLACFNDKPNRKMKLMFVMNKLNEGVHAKGINGIVWLRKLDSNSLTLYLQQLGRCIRTIEPGEIIDEKDRPLVLDLVNNTLNMRFEKETKIEIDLRKLNNAINWLKENNNIFPNKEIPNEKKCYNIFENIYFGYIDYINNNDLLNKQDITNRILIKEIINLGSSIDLWNMEFTKTSSIRKTSNESEKDILDAFGITGYERDFIEIVGEKWQKNKILFEEKFNYYYGLLVKLKKQGLPTNLSVDDKIKINEDGTISIIKIKRQMIDGQKKRINKEEYQDNSLIAIGTWLYNHQKDYDEFQKQKLRDIGYELQEDKKTFEDIFNYYYGLLEKMNKQGLSTNLSSTDKIKINEDGTISIIRKKFNNIKEKKEQTNQEEYFAEGLIPLGCWLYTHQKDYNKTQKKKLKDIGYGLIEDKKTFEDVFNYYCGLLEKIKKQGLPTNLSTGDKIKINEDETISIIKLKYKMINGKKEQTNQEEYFADGLISLGFWLYTHQKDYDEFQKQKLRDVGYELQEDKKTSEDIFNYYYGLLEKMSKQGLPTILSSGDKIKINEDETISIIKLKYKMINGKLEQINQEEYQDNSLIAIGSWLYDHQKDYDEFQKQKLRDIGYELREDKKTSEDIFNYYYGLLEQMKKQGLPTSLSTIDKIKINEDGTISIIKKKTQKIDEKKEQTNQEEYFAEGLIPLGSWLYEHQKDYDEIQKQKLRDIGYELIEDKKSFEDKFNYYYGLLEKLKKQDLSTDLSANDKIKISEDGTISIIKKKYKKSHGKKEQTNQEEYFAEGSINLGGWLYANQKDYDEIQKQKLRDIGYQLKEDKKKKYSKAKESFDEDSTFDKVSKKVEVKNNARKIH